MLNHSEVDGSDVGAVAVGGPEFGAIVGGPYAVVEGVGSAEVGIPVLSPFIPGFPKHFLGLGNLGFYVALLPLRAPVLLLQGFLN